MPILFVCSAFQARIMLIAAKSRFVPMGIKADFVAPPVSLAAWLPRILSSFAARNAMIFAG
jgi:hypothetical protein